MFLISRLPFLERERAKASFLLKLTIWSAKVVVKVIRRKTLGVRNLHRLQTCSPHEFNLVTSISRYESLDLQICIIQFFDSVFFHCVKLRKPQRQMDESYKIQDHSLLDASIKDQIFIDIHEKLFSCSILQMIKKLTLHYKIKS